MLHSDVLESSLRLADATLSAQAPRGAVETGFEWVAATGLDILNTTARSITFGAYEDTTQDWLQSLGMDEVLDTYQNHRDSIQAVSLIGGALIPGLAAIRGVNYMRAGMKGSNWFTTAGRNDNIAKVKELYAQGSKATAEYRTARNLVYRNAIANGMVDNVAAEFAIIGTMSAHPLMEEYMENPLAGIGMSLAIGGVLSTGIDTIVARKALLGAVGETKAKALNTVQAAMASGLANVDASITNTVTNRGSITTLQQIVDSSSETVTPLHKEIARTQIEKLKADNVELLAKAIPDTQLRGNEELVEEILTNPHSVGAEKLSYFKAKDEAGFLKRAQQKLTGFLHDDKVRTSNRGKLLDAVWDPKTKSMLSVGDAGLMTGAADHGGYKAIEELVQRMGKAAALKSPRANYLEHSLTGAPGLQEQDLYARILAAQKTETRDLSKVVVAEDDYASQMALSIVMRERKAQLETALGEADDALRVRIESELEELNSTKFRFMQGGDLSHTLTRAELKANNIPENMIPQLHDITADISAGSHDSLKRIQFEEEMPQSFRDLAERWENGASRAIIHVDPLTLERVADGAKDSVTMHAFEYVRRQLDAALRPAGSNNLIKRADWVDPMLKGNHGKQLRAEMRKWADKDGNIFLYRGLGVPRTEGHAVLESYTTSYAAAKKLGTYVEAYQVNVDDVVAYIGGLPIAGNDPSGRGIRSEFEVLVKNPSRTTLKALTQKAARTNEDGTFVIPGVEELTLADLEKRLPIMIGERVRSMLSHVDPKTGRAGNMDEVAQRLGLTPESVHSSLLATTGNPAYEVRLLKEAQEGEGLQDTIERLSSDRYRMVQMSANDALPTYAEYARNLKSGADHKTLDDLSNELIRHEFEHSASEIAKDMSKAVDPVFLELVTQQIGKINNELLQGRFFKSADFYVRKLGDLGATITHMSNKITNYSNDLIKREVQPLQAIAGNISKSKADLVLANTAYEVYKSINSSLGDIRFTGQSFEQQVKVQGTDGIVRKQWQTVQWQGQDFIIPESAKDVRTLFTEMGKLSKKLQQSRNTRSKIKGRKVHDIGYWLPNQSSRARLVSYVTTRKNGDITKEIIWGRTPEELARKRAILEKKADAEGYIVNITTPADANYQRIQQGMAPERMKEADLGQLKEGKTSTPFISDTAETLSDLMEGFQKNLQGEVSRSVSLLQHSVHRRLDEMKELEENLVKDQNLETALKERFGGSNAPSIVKSMLQGMPVTGDFKAWASVDNAAEWVVSEGLNLINKLGKPVGALKRGVLRQDASGVATFAKLSDDLAAKGYPNPWAQFEDQAPEAFRVARELHPTDSARRAISAANGLAATFALRLMELGQPLVNMVSLPILSYSASAHKYSDTFLGHAKNTDVPNPMGIMYDGMRMLNDPDYKDLMASWEKHGYVDPIVSEATSIMRMAHIQEPGAVAKIENFLDKFTIEKVRDHNGKLVETKKTNWSWLTKPSDFSEKFSRQAAMAMGTQLGVKLYGFNLRTEAGRNASLIFASDFMNRAIGNYVSSQRPVLFQGTAGAALGLFQTYMLTFAQNMYRHLEVKDYKALGTTALLQGGIFGVNSWPGFDLVSTYIGENFSDNHKDLRSGLYQAIPSQSVANAVLYGAPASMGALWGESNGMGMSSRGELSPRFPFITEDNVAAVSMLVDATKATGRVLEAAVDKPENVVQAVGEALTLQSVSRPVARITEILTGEALNQAEHTVNTSDDVWTPAGILSRLFAMRSADEVRQREANHLNKFYAAADAENRDKAMRKLRTALRAGSLSDDVISEVALEYLKTGSPQGFRAAMQQAVMGTEMGLEYDTIRNVTPESPLWRMLNDI